MFESPGFFMGMTEDVKLDNLFKLLQYGYLIINSISYTIPLNKHSIGGDGAQE